MIRIEASRLCDILPSGMTNHSHHQITKDSQGFAGAVASHPGGLPRTSDWSSRLRRRMLRAGAFTVRRRYTGSYGERAKRSTISGSQGSCASPALKRRGSRSRGTRLTRATRCRSPNVLARDFTAQRPDAVWASDITYVWSAEGWLYLVVFLDLYSRLVVGWAVSDNLEAGFVEQTFLQGQSRRGGAVSRLVHSDRGSQARQPRLPRQLAAWECQQSMSRKGNCSRQRSDGKFLRHFEE